VTDEEASTKTRRQLDRTKQEGKSHGNGEPVWSEANAGPLHGVDHTIENTVSSLHEKSRVPTVTLHIFVDHSSTLKYQLLLYTLPIDDLSTVSD
jgi:hypothetical protein